MSSIPIIAANSHKITYKALKATIAQFLQKCKNELSQKNFEAFQTNKSPTT